MIFFMFKILSSLFLNRGKHRQFIVETALPKPFLLCAPSVWEDGSTYTKFTPIWRYVQCAHHTCELFVSVQCEQFLWCVDKGIVGRYNERNVEMLGIMPSFSFHSRPVLLVLWFFYLFIVL